MYREILGGLAERIEHLGCRETGLGVKLLGNLPSVAPGAYLHAIYAGCQEDLIEDFETKESIRLPCAYKAFLKEMNGAKLFHSSLAFYGIVQRIEREGDAAYQPYSLSTINGFDRPDDASEDMFFIGSYNWDNSLIYMSRYDERVRCCAEESVEPMFEWESLESMLLMECERLASFFDENGIKLIPNKATSPSNGAMDA